MKTHQQSSLAASLIRPSVGSTAPNAFGAVLAGDPPTRLRTSLAVIAASLLCLLTAPGTNLAAAEPAPQQDLANQISRAALFYQNLRWVGTKPPAEAENTALLAEVQNMRKNGVPRALPGLEKFIADFPDSPWVPSLRANLGRYYREHGLYTRALHHWEAAWDATPGSHGRASQGRGRFHLRLLDEPARQFGKGGYSENPFPGNSRAGVRWRPVATGD